ncbi:MAG: DUF1569 domain-containing protein [Phycisphaerales bacterium]|nr:DUF1569 domain-containing protein [Phycisphaerales bacterium]
MSQVDRRKVEGRRELKFNCAGCLNSDLDRIQSAHDSGTLRTLGNWSAGQILQHCAKWIGFAMDGFPAQAPWIVRFFFKTFLKKRALQDVAMDPGMNLPKQAAFMLPDDHVTFEQGMSEMRAAVARLDAGDKMEQPSPILGDLTHEQWMGMMLRHSAMHHSFIQVEAPVLDEVVSEAAEGGPSSADLIEA